MWGGYDVLKECYARRIGSRYVRHRTEPEFLPVYKL